MHQNLFLGYPLNQKFLDDLAKIPPKKVSIFINDNTAYLQRTFHKNKHFLGKKLGNSVTLEEISLLEKNIHSLVKSLLPDAALLTPLLLFSEI